MLHFTKKISLGFTLIELLLAMFIFSLLSAIVVINLRSIIDTKAAQDVRAAQFSELQFTYTVLSRDLSQAVNRAMITQQGEIRSSFIGSQSLVFNLSRHQTVLELTRNGLSNPLFLDQRSTLVRVMYVLQEDALVRLVWTASDFQMASIPSEQVLLTDISAIDLSYYDPTSETHPSWQVIGDNNLEDVISALGSGFEITLPAAVSMQITLDSGEQFTWIFALAEIGNVYPL